MLPQAHDKNLAEQVAKFLMEQLAERKKLSIHELSAEDIGKATRDGQLLAMIAAARIANREQRGDKAIVVLSSSTRLRRADDKFRPQSGNPEAVISLSALSYLLSMLPDNSLGASALRRALFEFTIQPWSPQAERLALQVSKSAGNYDIPMARRVTLRHQLERSIRHEAERRGMKPEKLKKDFEAHNPAVPYAEIIGNAVREMAADSRELQRAKERIQELEHRITELENENAPTPARVAAGPGARRSAR